MPPSPYRANTHGAREGEARPFARPRRLRRSNASPTGRFEEPQKNAVDSSGWIEYSADDLSAEFFEDAILDTGSLVVPL